MKKLIPWVLAIALIIGVWLLVMELIWVTWCWVLPQIYPSGPHAFIAPGYWLFFGAWTLLSLVGKAIFGGGSKD